MVLSNAERQARFQKRLRERAAAGAGVTPEMVREATAIFYKRVCEYEGEPADWAAFLARCRKRRNGNSWAEMVPNDVQPDAYDWIEDERERELIERVATVTNAVLNPPQ